MSASKVIAKSLKYIIGTLFLVMGFLLVLSQTSAMQTRLVRTVLGHVLDTSKVRIDVGSIRLKPFNALVIKDATIVDRNPFVCAREELFDIDTTCDMASAAYVRNHPEMFRADTLAAIGMLTAKFDLRGLFNRKGIFCSSVSLSDAMLHLTVEPGTDTSSVTNLVRCFGIEKKPGKEKTDPDIIRIAQVNISNFRFRLTNLKKTRPKCKSEVVDWNCLDVKNIDIEADHFYLAGGYCGGHASSVSLDEKSGWNVRKISGTAKVGHGRTEITDLTILDNASNADIPSLVFSYPDARAWRDFVTEVRLTANINPSIISTETLGRLSRGLSGKKLRLNVSGDVDGYINDLNWKGLFIGNEEGSVAIVSDGGIKGLPELKDMNADLRISRSRLTTAGLDGMTEQFTGKKTGMGKFGKNETYALAGNVSGPLNHLRLNLNLHDRSGNAHLKGDIKNLAAAGKAIAIDCIAKTSDFNVGALIGSKSIGGLSLRTGLSADLAKGAPQVRFDSVFVDKLNFKGYDYQGIAAVGTYTGKAFDGKIVSSDPNLSLLFQGIFSFSPKTRNSVYQFYLNVGHADLQALHLFNNKGTARMSMETTANFTSFKGENLVGNIHIGNLNLTNEQGTHRIGDIDITSRDNDNTSRIQLTSGFGNISYTGTKFLTSFIRDLQAVTTVRDLPVLYKKPLDELPAFSGEESYALDVQISDIQDLISFFKPGMYIDDGTFLNLRLNQKGQLKGKFGSYRLAINDKYIKGADIDISNNNGISADLRADEISLSPLILKDNDLSIGVKDSHVTLGYNFDNKTSLENKAVINWEADVLREAGSNSLSVSSTLNPSCLVFNSQRWDFARSGIGIGKGWLQLDSLKADSDGQFLVADGGIRKEGSDTLRVDIGEFGTEILNSLTKTDYGIGGKISGNMQMISGEAYQRGLTLDLGIKGTKMAGKDLGDVYLKCLQDDNTKGIGFSGWNDLDGARNLDLTGIFYPGKKEADAIVTIDSLSVSHFSPFISSVFTGLDGTASGTVRVSGPMDRLNFESTECRLNDAHLVLDYTKVPYRADGPFHIDNTGVWFDDISLSDSRNHTGSLNGGIGWDHLKDINLDVKVNIREMQALGTTEHDNPDFFGTAWATGNVAVKGPLKALEINIAAATAGNGTVHIPVGGSGKTRSSNLLTFNEPEKVEREDRYESYLKSLKTKDKKANKMKVALDLRVNSDTQGYLNLDKDAENVITARGDGGIMIYVEPSASIFTLNGNYDILEGNCHINAMGIAKRDFSINRGSGVRFEGNVMDTDLDIDAIYRVKTSIGRLIADTTATTSRKTVECGIHISDKLRDPRVSFSINVPDLDPSTKAEVESALATEDKLQKQFLALLVSGSFLPDDESGIVANTTTNLLYSNVTEIMANQLNNILEKLDIPLDFGLDYQQNNGENIFDVAVSTALFKNKVIVNGSLGNKSYYTSGAISGDIDIEVKLDKTGSTRLKLFSHSADDYTNYLDYLQRNGIGVSYQQEFNSFGEFLRNIFTSKAKKKEREAERQKSLNEEQKTVIVAEPRSPSNKKDK